MVFLPQEHNVLEKLSEISLPHWSKIRGFTISILYILVLKWLLEKKK